MVAVAEQAVVGPVGRRGADRDHRNVVDKEHDDRENRQAEPAVRDDLVDLVGGRKLADGFLLIAGLDDRGDIDVPLVGDDAFGVVVQLLFGRLNVRFDVRKRLLVDVQLAENLVVALEDLDGVPALLLLGHAVDRRLFDVGDRVLDAAGEGVHRDRLRVLCRVDRGLRRLHDPGALQRRNLDDLAAELAAELGRVDLVAVLAHDVHHVDGDDDRDAELGELGGQVQVSLEVRAVDDVQDDVRAFADQVISGDHFLQRVGGKGVNARQVGHDHAAVLFQLAFLFLDRDARPVAHELVGAGERVEQGSLTAVRVARKGDS